MPPCSLCDSVPGATSNHQSHAVLFLASGQRPRLYPRIRGHYLHIIFKGLFQFFRYVEIVLENTGVPQYQKLIVQSKQKKNKIKKLFSLLQFRNSVLPSCIYFKKNLRRKYKQLQFYLQAFYNNEIIPCSTDRTAK